MREVVIAGTGLVRFNTYEEAHYVLSTEALRKALTDSGFSWREIQAAYCGSVYQGTGSGHQALREIGLTGIPIVNNEAACSSGAVAMMLGYQAI